MDPVSTGVMSAKAMDVGLTAVGRILDGFKAGNAESLIDYTRSLRAEPLMLVDSDALFYENTPDVSQSLLACFAGYYFLAWHTMTANINNIAVARQLDRLNPSRAVGNTVVDGLATVWNIGAMSNESHSLPRVFRQDSLESKDSRSTSSAKEDAMQSQIAKMAILGTPTSDAKTADKIHEVNNLSVGKILNVEISEGSRKLSIPVQIRLIANSMQSGVLKKLLATGSYDTTTKGRWHQWRAGRLRFFRDLLLCQDLIDNHRKNLIKDTSGIYTEITNRARTNRLSGLLSVNPSIATASNLVITTTSTIQQLEAEINGEFDDYKVRQGIFNQTYLMIVAVIDKQYDRVKFYHRGIAQPTDMSIREIRAANKGGGPNITDLLKAYTLGNTPTF